MWSVSKALQIPLDSRIKELADLPYTISFVVRKRQQIDNLSELPKDKKPPESMIWDGSPEEMEEWLEKVFDNKHQKDVTFSINPKEVEG